MNHFTGWCNTFIKQTIDSAEMTNFSTTIEDINREMSLNALPVMIFIGIIAVVGIIGNCVVFHVYSKKYPKCNFKYFVLILAGIDLISCLLLMPLEIVTLTYWFVFPYAWLCKVKSFMNAYTVCASASCLLLIAIDRFKKVCRPHSKQIQPERAVKLAGLVLSLSLIPATSDALFWGLHTHKVNGIKELATICEKDDKYKDTIWPILHTLVLYAGTDIVIMASTLVLYSCIAIKLFCMTGGKQVQTPEITISTPDNDANETGAGNKETMFKFGDIESGLSESEDIDKSSTARISSGSLIESDIDIQDRNSNSFQLEAVPLRHKTKNDIEKNAEKHVRISVEISETNVQYNVGNNLKLQIPDVTMRRKQSNTKSPKSPHYKLQRRRRSTAASLVGAVGTRLRRKTLIMFILTVVFVITTLVYFSLIGHMADRSHFMTNLNFSERAAWLFFLRLYFINSVINPLLYGFLDPRFKKALWNMGVHMTWMAGSLKRNIGNTVRRSNSNSSKHAISVYQTDVNLKN